MTCLLDINGVLALMLRQHEDHARAHRFFARRGFAISPQIQLGVLRFLTRPRRIGESEFPPLHTADEAWRLVQILCNTKAKPWIPDDLNCAADVPFHRVTGHRQWNDFYLVALARKHGFRLATCDQAIKTFFPEIVQIIPAC